MTVVVVAFGLSGCTCRSMAAPDGDANDGARIRDGISAPGASIEVPLTPFERGCASGQGREELILVSDASPADRVGYIWITGIYDDLGPPVGTFSDSIRQETATIVDGGVWIRQPPKTLPVEGAQRHVRLLLDYGHKRGVLQLPYSLWQLTECVAASDY
jgi:hypothetical protein